MKLLKKTALALFAVCILVICTVLCAANISAAKITDSGECGDNVTWTLYDNGDLVIDGSGAMWNWEDISTAPWTDYQASIKKISVGDSITTIGTYAFSNLQNLTDVVVGDSVTEIGKYSLCLNPVLTDVTFGDSVEIIGKYAFADCLALETIEIPNGVTAIHDGAFIHCIELKETTIPETVKSIGYQAFVSCFSLETARIFSLDTEYDFRGVFVDSSDNLTIYAHKGSTAEAHAKAFDILFADLSEYAAPTETEAIETAAPETEPPLPENAIASGKCGDNITWVLYNDNTLVIEGSGEMWNWEEKKAPWADYRFSIPKIIIGDGVTTIGDYAFWWFKNLTDITLPNSLTAIGNSAFAHCKTLTKIDLPETLTSIGESAFVYALLTSITIPDGVTEIESSVFENCVALAIVDLPETLTSIGDAAFCYCLSMKELTIPDSVTTIGVSALGLTGLTSFVIPDSVTSIGDGAFSGSHLASITIGKGVETIGNGAFKGCFYLREITIPDNVKSIGEKAFYHCPLLESVILPENLTSIGKYTFQLCEKLSSITIGKNVSSIHDLAFYECKALERLIVDENNANYSSDESGVLFNKDKTALLLYPIGKKETSYTVPYGVASIAPFAFSKCWILETVILPETVTSIGESAFQDCSQLKHLQILNSKMDFGIRAFNNTHATLVMYGLKGSTTENYAILQDIDYIALNDTDIPETDAPLINFGRIIGEGTIDDNMTWAMYVNDNNTGTLVISGTGLMKNWSKGSTPWDKYKNSVHTLVLSNGIKSVGDYAFFAFSNLTKITLPNSITAIGRYAFCQCQKLSEITFPNKLLTIKKSAFASCSFTEVTIPDSVKKVGENAFMNNLTLKNATIGSGLIYLDNCAFDYCENLESVTIFSPKATIDPTAFGYIVPENLTISGYKKSTAEKEAKHHKLPFIALISNVLGDIDSDGTVDISDAITLFQFSMMSDIYEVTYTGSMDFTKDGSVDVADAIKLFRFSMMPDIYPID